LKNLLLARFLDHRRREGGQNLGGYAAPNSPKLCGPVSFGQRGALFGYEIEEQKDSGKLPCGYHGVLAFKAPPEWLWAGLAGLGKWALMKVSTTCQPNIALNIQCAREFFGKE
jgi:hypothetical protein